MLKGLVNRAADYLFERAFDGEQELHLYLMSYAGAFFCFFVHLYYLVIFLVYHIGRLAVINSVILLLYAAIFSLIQRGRYVKVGLLISFEVTVYTTLLSCLYGIDTYIVSHYLLIIIMQAAVPYGSLRLRVGVILSVMLCATFAVLIGVYGTTPYQFLPSLRRFMTIVNIYLLFTATVIQLFVGNLVRLVVSRLHKARMDTLARRVNTDALTGLYNRWYAEICYSRIIKQEHSQSHCIALLDIDNFKAINDNHGHAAGDEVLKMLATFLRTHLRKTDVVFRWGGEEFLILLERIELDAAYELMDKLRRDLARQSVPLHTGVLSITVTIGVGRLDINKPYESIDRCDRGLYAGKRASKNVTVRV